MTTVLARSDFHRSPILAANRADGFKEWHHFVVHGRDVRVLVNFSVTTETSVDGRPRVVPRMIVIAHDHRWTGVVERFEPTESEVSADLSDLTVGASRMRVLPDGYRVKIELPQRDIHGMLEFTSVSRPFVVNNQPVGGGRMNWLFVPRLRVDGWLRVGGRAHRFDDELAYHDHNWGRFRWGDDFGWTWGTILPHDRDVPWSMVFLQMTDRRRLHFHSQAVYVWRHDEPAAILLRAAVTARHHGTLPHEPDCTLPPQMRLVLDGHVPGVPELVEIDAARASDTVRAEFRTESYARLAHPSELHLDRSTVLCEASGTAHVSGDLGGEHFDFVGPSIFEFLHG